MRKSYLLFLLLLSVSLFSQVKVLESSEKKKPKWTTEIERDFILGIGKAADMKVAQENAMQQIKAQIVSSVADNVVSSSELKTTEITVDKISKQFQSFSGTISTRSAQQDFLQGISIVNVKESYWEKLQDKNTKEIYYQYFLKYPFNSWDLEKLVAAFKLRDKELTDELNATLDRLNTFKSIEELRECKSILIGLEQYFVDQRKVKAQVGVEKSLQLLNSVILRNEGSTLGTLKYALYIDNRIITFSARPTIMTPCAVVEDKRFGTEICQLKYRYDECYGDVDNKIFISYNIPEGKKAENTFYFDINENKVELQIIGVIRITPGSIEEESVRNAVCKIELVSKFDNPATVTNVVLEWKQYGIVIDVPVNQTIQGKGTHILEFNIPSIPMAQVSTMLNPENKVNGYVNYTSGTSNQKIRIYQKDYITSW
ncbi:hypothetical protein MASR2M117_02010 [Paludibacter sp.]